MRHALTVPQAGRTTRRVSLAPTPRPSSPRLFLSVATALFAAVMTCPAHALEGQLRSHDPSTVARCNGRYYVFSTGPGIPILESDDGFTWKSGGRVFEAIPESVRSLSPKNDGKLVWAPDIIESNGEYLLYYSVSAWGSFVSAVGLISNPTLDRNDPRYKWTDRGPIVNSTEGQDLNAIDPGVVKGADGSLWLCYGSYHGNIEIVQLDSKTGRRIAPNSPVTVIANRSEAADIIFRDGWYYLLVNHGSCCKGKDSGYNIRVGRSRNVTGPYLDRDGENLADGAGTLFLAAQGNQIGPGHFGRFFDDGVEKFSCHYEADLDRDGRPVLDIRPLLWTLDGWPLPGANLKDGTYQLVSERTGSVLERAPKHLEDSEITVGTYVVLNTQQWRVTSAGGGYVRILLTADGKALETAKVDGRGAVVRVAAVSESDDQLWKVDQLTDGTYRVMSKVARQALTVNPDGALSVKPFDGARAQCWRIATP